MCRLLFGSFPEMKMVLQLMSFVDQNLFVNTPLVIKCLVMFKECHSGVLVLWHQSKIHICKNRDVNKKIILLQSGFCSYPSSEQYLFPIPKGGWVDSWDSSWRINWLIALFEAKLGPHDPFLHGLTSNLRKKLVAGPYLRVLGELEKRRFHSSRLIVLWNGELDMSHHVE